MTLPGTRRLGQNQELPWPRRLTAYSVALPPYLLAGGTPENGFQDDNKQTVFHKVYITTSRLGKGQSRSEASKRLSYTKVTPGRVSLHVV